MLVDDLEAKIAEQLERTVHLMGLLPAGQVQWRPAIANAWSAGELLGHILDCIAGLCAVLYAANPEALPHFAALRARAVNHDCGPAEACERVGIYSRHLREGFAVLGDADLARLLPTVFVPAGESLLTLLLGNLEHLINHKHQLFTYLKWMGVNVGTPDLYHFR
jgi:hypothetical protein